MLTNNCVCSRKKCNLWHSSGVLVFLGRFVFVHGFLKLVLLLFILVCLMLISRRMCFSSLCVKIIS